MNHGKEGRKLERNRNGRRALVRCLLESLILHGKIRTTVAKAKEIKSRIDRVLGLAKRSALAAEPSLRVSTLRLLRKRVSLVTLHQLSDVSFLKKFETRTSGYARVVKLPPRRSDGAKMAILELVD